MWYRPRGDSNRDKIIVPSASTALCATRPSDIVNAPPSGRELKETARRLAVHCARFRGAIPAVAFWQLGSTLALFVVVIGLMFMTVERHYSLTLLLALPAGGLLVRLFIIQHDCGHGSFLKGRIANDTVGRLVSVLTVTPYEVWRREHAKHHATSGNLEERGIGDIDTLTVREYQQLPAWRKIWYRIYRNPLFLFGFAVPFYFMVLQRVPVDHPLPRAQAWASVMGLNAAMVALYAALGLIFGFWNLLFVVLPVVHIAAAVGGWLFYVQHQFDETHWNRPPDWDVQVAAVFGSSYYVLPPVLNWFTGNIGLHHIHHLNSMIPNYRLMACLKSSPDLQSLNRLTLWQSFKCVNHKLWDEDRRMLVGFEAVRPQLARLI
jgi:acyl-lipid omega-6 desaturase (Delta-12 desaturase)